MRDRHGLRLVAADGKLIGPAPPVPVITGVGHCLAQMRAASAVLTALPADLFSGYSRQELAAQYCAVDRMVETFAVLDRLLVSRGVHAVNTDPTRRGEEE